MRRALFQVHLWMGLLTGVYIFLVSITGAALVFRIDMQRALYPHLFTASATGPLADPLAIMESVSRAYPDRKLSGVDAPTSARPTYLAYVTRGTEFLTILIDPVSGTVLGELPDRTIVRTVQDLHFNLMLGRNGRVVNGVGAICTLLMCLTGLVIWWPGAGGIGRAFLVTFNRGWKRLIWELHRAAGAWSVVFIAMWAVTGLSFGFPKEFRSVVTSVSPITVSRQPQSEKADAAVAPVRPSWRTQIDTAKTVVPDQHVARVVLPFNDRAAFLVMFATASPTPAGATLTPVYLDQFTGRVLPEARAPKTLGDRIMSWMVPLHVGDFSSRTLKLLWFIIGLMPPLLFVTGLTMWWRRGWSKS